MAYQHQSHKKAKKIVKRPVEFRSKAVRFVNLLFKAFNHLSIGQKLNAGLGVLVLMTFLVVARNYVGSLSATRNIEQTQQVRIPAVLASTQAQEELLRMSAHVRGYLITGRSEFRDRYYTSRQGFEKNLIAMIDLLESDLSSAASSLSSAASSPVNQSQLDQLRSNYDKWRQIPDELFVLSDRVLENQPALKLFQEEGELAFLKIQSDTQKLLDLQTQRVSSERNTEIFKEISAFQNAHTLVSASLRAYIITRASDFRFEYAGQQRAATEHWEKIVARKALLSPEQQSLVDSIETYRQQLESIMPEMLSIVEGDRYREDLFVFNSQAEPIAEEMLALLNEIVINQQQLLEDELALGKRELVRAQLQTLVGSFFALGLAFSMALLLRQKIADPIVRLTQATTQIIEGNLDTKTAVESQDEIGTLAKTFNQMTGYLKQSRHKLEQSNTVLASQKTELESKNAQVELALSALKEAQSQLIQAEKMSGLGQMVAGIAHEINNPVSFIRGNLPCIQNYTTDLIELIQLYQSDYPQPNAEIAEKIEDIELPFLLEDIPRVLKSMEAGTGRIRDIVLSLRNFSRLDESELKAVNVREGLESTLLILQKRLGPQAARPAIKLVGHYGKLPDIECYPGQLNQVFLNILTNAIDAIDADSIQGAYDQLHPQITIRTEAKGDCITISIEDNGEGIKTDIEGRIFDPFFTTKSVGSGTGMGLSVSHKIVVDRHGGTLDCSASQDKGTTFTVTLPCKQTCIASREERNSPIS